MFGALVLSVVLGADVGVIVYSLSFWLPAALLSGTAAGALLMYVTARYQWARWCNASVAPKRGMR